MLQSPCLTSSAHYFIHIITSKLQSSFERCSPCNRACQRAQLQCLSQCQLLVLHKICHHQTRRSVDAAFAVDQHRTSLSLLMYEVTCRIQEGQRGADTIVLWEHVDTSSDGRNRQERGISMNIWYTPPWHVEMCGIYNSMLPKNHNTMVKQYQNRTKTYSAYHCRFQ